jgi:hypothetical protein
LPPASQFRFEATEALTPSIQNELDKRLDAFVSYVNKLGFPPDKNKPSIKIDKLAAPAAWYHPDGNRIVIDAKLVGDPSVVLHEYVHRVLLTRGELPRWIPEREFARIESGVADYFVGSFLGVARIGEEASKVPEMSSSWMRVLEKELKFENRGFVKDQFRSLHDGAEVWGSALWALRTTLGSEVLDPIVATAWLAAKWPLDDDKEMPLAFTTALITTVKQKASGQADEVKAILQRRGFPVPR